MYFRMQGSDGRKIVATTCTNSAVVNDTVIDVYLECEPKDSKTNPGSGKYCYASNDDYCGLGASVTFKTVNRPYYIAVSSAAPTLEGVAFSLLIKAVRETENDNSQCWFAEEITFPDVLKGNTSYMDGCDQTCDGSKKYRHGAWFRYTHKGEPKTITASTCNQFNKLNAKIEVYKNCNDGKCHVQSHPKNGCTNATFVVQEDVTYSIFITDDDDNGNGGYFNVDFYEAAPSSHSTCESAHFVNLGSLPYRLEDNTILAEPSYSDCDNTTKKGIWIEVIGTGNKIVATTCDEHTGYDSYIELFNHCPDGNDPHPEYCLDFNDDSPQCNHAAEIEWASQSQAHYFLFVTGFSSEAGIFTLKIYEKESLINAKCRTSVGIHRLPYYDYGLTTYCEMTNASCTPIPRKGNWYDIVGNGHWITVSTCNSETDFATEIEIYLDCDENGGSTCVNHNHDQSCSPRTTISFAGIEGTRFFIFVTGVNEAVLSEGFFGITVTQGEKLPATGKSSYEAGLTSFEGFLISVGVLMGCGAIAACCAVAYGLYKRHHVSYQEIPSSSSS